MARFKIAVRLLDGEQQLPDPLGGNELTRRVRPNSSADLTEMEKMGLTGISEAEARKLFFSQVTTTTGIGWIERLPGIQLLGSRQLTPA
ncbi:hypothetical protein EPO04_02345 [Patescibacteria group bacterium]|nr:MAG: hypothetical protein EPO04_02345 [Patescibacteria group bacterium]